VRWCWRTGIRSGHPSGREAKFLYVKKDAIFCRYQSSCCKKDRCEQNEFLLQIVFTPPQYPSFVMVTEKFLLPRYKTACTRGFKGRLELIIPFSR
jgi:hypothetical protein